MKLGDSAPAAYKPFPAFRDWDYENLETSGFDAYADKLFQARSKASVEQLGKSVTTAMRYAAIDTNAIEGIYQTDRGFTRTVATQAIAWESMMEARGSHVRPAFDDALAAYEYVLDAATNRVQITEHWIRTLHEIICGSQDTFTVETAIGPQLQQLAKGRYKTFPNSPTRNDGSVHHYAPVAETPPEMARLIHELSSPDFSTAHPVVQAAYAHYAFVGVHPFPDGNGRVARALASVFLYREPGVPLVIFADQRNEYYDALEVADIGDPGAFIQFIAARALDTINIMTMTIARSGASASHSLGRVRQILGVDEINSTLRPAALRLKSLVFAELSKQFNELDVPAQIDAHVNPNKVSNLPTPTGYADVGKEAHFYMMASSSWPREFRLLRGSGIFARKDSSAIADLLVVNDADQRLEVMIDEIEPLETESLRLKVRIWVEGLVDGFFADVEDLARGS